MNRYIAILEAPDGRKFRFVIKAYYKEVAIEWLGTHNYCIERGWKLLSIRKG